MNFRNFAPEMIWNPNTQPKERIRGDGDWPDAEWPGYIPKHHLRDFAAIDFEAANAELTSVCSMGVVIVRNDEIVDRFYSLVHPVPDYYDFWTTKVHGIKKKDTENADIFPVVWYQVAHKLKGLAMVAHGKSFDERCLKALHKYYRIKYPNYPFYCTHLGSQQLVPDVENHKLQSVALHFGYDIEKNHHNALADAEACAVIAMHIF